MGGIESPWDVKGRFRASKARVPQAFGGPRGAKMRPKWGPRRSKIEVKNEVQKTMLLKIVLEPSWVDLGSFWVPSCKAKIV